METYLVTGGAGFIGANFIKFLLKKYQEIKIICLDNLVQYGLKLLPVSVCWFIFGP